MSGGSGNLNDAEMVAVYIKGHPDAEGADVDEVGAGGQVVARFIGERTIAGWIMSPGPEASETPPSRS